MYPGDSPCNPMHPNKVEYRQIKPADFQGSLRGQSSRFQLPDEPWTQFVHASQFPL